ncbi:MAG: AsmA family protein, partial [Acetobacteraceae bacterium]|nr:AsmA family protein [Acetobacteraceae bacterium]
PPAEPPVSAPPARPPAPAQRAPLFSNTPLPFGVLTLADADLGLTIGALRARGTAYRDIRARLVLADGKLTLDPLAAGAQGGHLDARLTADARAESPPVALVLRGTGIDLTPLLAVLGAPEAARGAVDLDLDLHGTGQTAHALALSADGHLGAAMVDGAIDNRVITAALGTVLAQAHLPNLASRPGTTAVRCLAVRLDAHGGTANLRTFLLDTPLFAIEGGGTLDLAQETLALRLRPLARLGGTGVIVPLRLAGPFQSPKVEVDASGRAGGGAGTTAQEPASIIIGALTDDRRVAGTGGEGCPAALAEARGGIAGRTPAASPQEAPKPPKPADLLRQFLR